LADGPTIQESSTAALKSGMTTQLLFDQLKDVRKTIHIPLIIMGYFNPMLQYGVEKFCATCAEIGIDGLIMPDLPLAEYEAEYKAIFEKYGLINVFLITPQTSDARIKQIDAASDGFIYMVSSASTTGAQSGFGNTTTDYFKRIHDMQLKNQQIVGFGISNTETFEAATAFAKGAIIGSAFVKHLTANGPDSVEAFVKKIR
jgi:tryptophan synthase alpha chain